jgi:hypothetical protein
MSTAFDALVDAARAEVDALRLQVRSLEADLALARHASDALRAERDSAVLRLVAYMAVNPPTPPEPVEEVPLDERLQVMADADAAIRRG